MALAVLWMLLSWHFEPLMLAFGIVSIAFVCWISVRMHIVDGESYPFGLVPKLTGYWMWLLKEIVKSNLDTARRVLGSDSQVAPVVFSAPAVQKDELALVVHANSITLTPGTVSLEFEEGGISVHALHPDVEKATRESRFNELVPDP